MRRWTVGPETIGSGIGGVGREAGQSLGVAPRHPGHGVECDRGLMALQGHQVVEGLHVVQLRGMDQAHEEVADLGAVVSSNWI